MLLNDRVLTALDARLHKLENQEIWYERFFRQTVAGDLYLSRNPVALDATAFNVVDFWFNTGTQKFVTRGIISNDLDNRVQYIGARFVGNGDGYSRANTTIIAGDAEFSLIGAGGVSLGAYADYSVSGEITFSPDPAHMPWDSTSSPGIIIFQNVRQGQSGIGGNFTSLDQTIFDSEGIWIMGINGGSWSSYPDHSTYTARLNLRKDPGNQGFSAIKMFHASDPTAGQVGQNIDMGFYLRGNSGAGNTWIEAGRITVSKESDFTTLADQDAQMRFAIVFDGTVEARLTFNTTLVETHAQLLTVAATTDRYSIRLPHGTAPTGAALQDGAMWTTTAGLFVRVNGVTIGPLS